MFSPADTGPLHCLSTSLLLLWLAMSSYLVLIWWVPLLSTPFIPSQVHVYVHKMMKGWRNEIVLLSEEQSVGLRAHWDKVICHIKHGTVVTFGCQLGGLRIPMGTYLSAPYGLSRLGLESRRHSKCGRCLPTGLALSKNKHFSLSPAWTQCDQLPPAPATYLPLRGVLCPCNCRPK